MKRLTSAQSLVYTLMDKLGPVREVLVQKDDDWEKWGLEELVENLRKYVERNPIKESGNSGRIDENSRNHPGHTYKNSSWKRDREKMLLGNNGRSRPNQRPTCVYCN